MLHVAEDENRMSFDRGMMMHERDKKRAAFLFRTQSLGQSKSFQDDNFLGNNFEPDWTRFESVFATGENPVFIEVRHKNILHSLICF